MNGEGHPKGARRDSSEKRGCEGTGELNVVEQDWREVIRGRRMDMVDIQVENVSLKPF